MLSIWSSPKFCLVKQFGKVLTGVFGQTESFISVSDRDKISCLDFNLLPSNEVFE